MDTQTWVRRGIYAAAATNILGSLIFSKGYGDALGAQFPALFGTWGLILIQVWGLAYLAGARPWPRTSPLFLVFAIEKAVYVASWALWLLQRGGDLPALFANDPMTALFFASYGLVDGLFGLFFLWGWHRGRQGLAQETASS